MNFLFFEMWASPRYIWPRPNWFSFFFYQTNLIPPSKDFFRSFSHTHTPNRLIYGIFFSPTPCDSFKSIFIPIFSSRAIPSDNRFYANLPDFSTTWKYKSTSRSRSTWSYTQPNKARWRGHTSLATAPPAQTHSSDPQCKHN